MPLPLCSCLPPSTTHPVHVLDMKLVLTHPVLPSQPLVTSPPSAGYRRSGPGQVLMVTTTLSHQPSCLFFVTDHSSGLWLLVYTAVLPVYCLSHFSSSTGSTIQAVNHSATTTFGSTCQTIKPGHIDSLC